MVESFLMGHEGTTMSTRRLPELAGTNSKAERLAECRNTVDWCMVGLGKESRILQSIWHLQNIN